MRKTDPVDGKRGTDDGLGSLEFTTDAVHGLLQAWEVPEPHEPRALGPIMQRAIKRGICVPTGVYRPSVRPACNCRPIMVYRSLIYRSQAA